MWNAPSSEDSHGSIKVGAIINHKSSLGHSIGELDTVTSCVQELEPMYPSTDQHCNMIVGVLKTSVQAWMISPQFSSVHFSPSVVPDSLQTHGLQHARPPCPSPTPRIYPNPSPLSQWCHPTISSLSPPAPPALNLSQHQGLFKWVSSLHQVAKVLEFQVQHQSFQWTLRTDLL